jgi:hypothetical protein
MQTSTPERRFQSQGDWAFVPGPGSMTDPLDSQDAHDVELHTPEQIAQSLLRFPGMQLLHAATPSWWKWRARWAEGSSYIEVGMTLFDDEGQSWGGSPVQANCSYEDLHSLWSYLQSRHRGVWFHDSGCTMHTHESFTKFVAA